jgi:erythronate-4-phosphate dehydrogenase
MPPGLKGKENYTFMKIIADRDIPFLKGVLEPFADVEYMPGKEISRNHLYDADALLTRTRTICNEKLLAGTAVKFIGTATIGYDHIDTEYCESKGIIWKNAPGCNSSSVNQYVASALATLSEKYGFDLSGRSMGVVGVGHVGSKVVRTAELLGMHVYLCDPPKVEKEGACGFISLEGIVRESDIISFHVPLTSTGKYPTFHMINDSFLEAVKPGTIIINTSRGSVSDNQGLKRFVAGRKGILVIDVWENEPFIDRELLCMADICTPHIAGYSADGKANATAAIVNELSLFFNLILNGWKPVNIPAPSNNEINIDCKKLSGEEVIRKAVIASYDIMRDDRALRRTPFNFEKLRAEYPVRREFPAYTIVTEGIAGKDTERLCRKMGFKVKTT